MHIISIPRLRQFYQRHAGAKQALTLWITYAKHGRWTSFADVKQVYPTARMDGRFTIFKIRGNSYRLIVRIEYRMQRIYIRHILTHEEYNHKRWKRDEWHN